ncbi:hypothetical protein BBF96_03505 [Anoxybacter fermentans]|uniref:Uncharacterized protein n=1 Tax=Anoxybacter fermentans TaxID=1323375 RepID=A0A3Q9HPD7_9FIRM|nr:HK97 gp10 family phage protein [Anoxybacter fermentans]AZR72529.1 hypothetical protein BBF96_03505 [Anoxybacter fermentans]
MAQNQWIEVEFRGNDGQIYRLQQIKSRIENKIELIMLRAAQKLEREVKLVIRSLGLIKTGSLMSSIHTFVRYQFGLVEGVVGTNQIYAPFLEFGTGKRGAASNYPKKMMPSWYQYGESPGMRAFKYMLIAWERKKDEVYAYVNMEFRRLVYGR